MFESVVDISHPLKHKAELVSLFSLGLESFQQLECGVCLANLKHLGHAKSAYMTLRLLATAREKAAFEQADAPVSQDSNCGRHAITGPCQ